MKWIRNKLIQYLTRNLLVAVTLDDILTITNRGVYIGKRKLTQEELMQIKDEAKQFQDSYTWKIMTRDVRYIANLRMFEQGIIPENTTFGRGMLYNLEIIEKFMQRVQNL